MAKREVTAQQLVVIEDDLHKIAGDIKAIRKELEVSGEPSVMLDIGTVLFYVNFMAGWGSKNRATAPAQLKAQIDRRAKPAKPRKS